MPWSLSRHSTTRRGCVTTVQIWPVCFNPHYTASFSLLEFLSYFSFPFPQNKESTVDASLQIRMRNNTHTSTALLDTAYLLITLLIQNVDFILWCGISVVFWISMLHHIKTIYILNFLLDLILPTSIVSLPLFVLSTLLIIINQQFLCVFVKVHTATLIVVPIVIKVFGQVL